MQSYALGLQCAVWKEESDRMAMPTLQFGYRQVARSQFEFFEPMLDGLKVAFQSSLVTGRELVTIPVTISLCAAIQCRIIG
jgi:hypothetical protein